MDDLVIRGATVIDGTGAASRIADVSRPGRTNFGRGAPAH